MLSRNHRRVLRAISRVKFCFCHPFREISGIIHGGEGWTGILAVKKVNFQYVWYIAPGHRWRSWDGYPLVSSNVENLTNWRFIAKKIINWLVVWNIFFFHILGIIIPTDFHIFQRGRSTTNQSNVGFAWPCLISRGYLKVVDSLHGFSWCTRKDLVGRRATGWLVVWNHALFFLTFHNILGIITSNWLSFFKMIKATNQIVW